MNAVKIFTDPSLFDLEDSVNAWLTVNAQIQVINISQSSFQYDDEEPLHSISIVYKAA